MSLVMTICGILTLVAGCGVVFSRRSLTSALWLAAAVVMVGVHFALLGAGFLAVLQLLIYAGAIVVLMVFVVMLLGVDAGMEWAPVKLPSYIGAVVCGLFAGALLLVGAAPLRWLPSAAAGQPESGAAAMGRILLTDHLLSFQLAGMLLFAAVVGAALLSLETRRPLKPGRGLRAARLRWSAAEEEKES